MSKHPDAWNRFREARRAARRQRAIDRALNNLPAPIEDDAIEAPPIPRATPFPWRAVALGALGWAGVVALVWWLW